MSIAAVAPVAVAPVAVAPVAVAPVVPPAAIPAAATTGWGFSSLHNRYTDFITENSGLGKIFRIATTGKDADGTVMKIVKAVTLFFASVILLPMAVVGSVFGYLKGMCQSPVEPVVPVNTPAEKKADVAQAPQATTPPVEKPVTTPPTTQSATDPDKVN